MKKGFSIIELICGIGIISITLLMVVALYSYMIKASSKGIEHTVASSLANMISSDLSYSIIKDAKIDLGRSSNNYKPLSEGNVNVYCGSVSMNGASYCYMVELAPVSMSSGRNSADMAKADIAVFYRTAVSEQSDGDLSDGSDSFFSGINSISNAVSLKGSKGDGTGFSFIRMTRLYLIES